MSDTKDLLDKGAARLRAAGVDSSRLEARLMLGYVLRLTQEELIAGGAAANAEQAREYEDLIARREKREPLAYILGRREFWSLGFIVGPGVLVPRPETETLISEALKSFPDKSAKLDVLDLGTGSGCLLLAFLHERPEARGLGTDISPEALTIAGANADNLGLGARTRFARSNWLDQVKDTFDVIFSNPPYITEDEMKALDADVREFEPKLALYGGKDGLDAYRVLALQLPKHMRRGSRAFIEIGASQYEQTQTIFRNAGFHVRGAADLMGCARCLVLGLEPAGEGA